MAEKSAFCALVLFSDLARFSEKTTSLESNAEPSWNFAPIRSLKVYLRPLSEIDHDSANAGRTSAF